MNAFPSVFVVLDPVQDYEESDEILGVYGSLRAAKYAARAVRRKCHRIAPYYTEYGNRHLEIQEWQGPQLHKTWDYSPYTKKWSEVKESGR
ncbi:hypothetical protein [Devriesea agamarum]|uniref:hypothetical protein n=1 Tax=Devriesea agamarum TaxID=472569 RepID=UPI00071E4704|nr:hypothetical protein [Devriesea agamarum]